ncbi:MAG: hypothetical protein ACR2FH_05535 [Caulobacteraceae bacterium]
MDKSLRDRQPAALIGMALTIAGGLVIFALAVYVVVARVGGGPPAPSDRGVCWRDYGRRGFVIVARDVASLDDCAAELEAIHLIGQPRVTGAFQGYYILIDERQIASASRLGGFGYPIFQPAQRREIDADLRALIAERKGALPAAADIAVRRR